MAGNQLEDGVYDEQMKEIAQITSLQHSPENMTENQLVAIIDHDQLREIAQNSSHQQNSEISNEKRWRMWLPKIKSNHITAMMFVCIAISSFITVFSLLMILVPFLSELSKYEEMVKANSEWSDKAAYRTLDPSTQKFRFKRSVKERMETPNELESIKTVENCFDRLKRLQLDTEDGIDNNAWENEAFRKQVEILLNDCKPSLENVILNSSLNSDKLKPTLLTHIYTRSVSPKEDKKIKKGDGIPAYSNMVNYGHVSGDIPPTGPEVSSPGEAIQTSQQLTVSLPQVLQQTCILKPSKSFPPGPPTYICYPGTNVPKARDPQFSSPQPIHIPTAISSPNPYYFPTVAGSPVINPLYVSKPSYNPSVGIVKIPSQTQKIPQIQFQQAPYNPYPFQPTHQAVYPQLNNAAQNPVIQLHVNPFTAPRPVYQPVNLLPGSQVQVQCSYSPAPGTPYQEFAFPPVPGVNERERSDVNHHLNNTKYRSQNKEAGRNDCTVGEVSCGDDGAQNCIAASSVCDFKVDCPNAQDELNCSCKSRISRHKHCDGIADCPQSEDELQCHGCGAGWFSCGDDNAVEATCIPLSARCDGVAQCPNRQDEIDCVLLADNLFSQQGPFVSYNEGFLHHNWRGQWFPVCMEKGPVDLARQACISEMGFRDKRNPDIGYVAKPESYNGPFIRMGRAGVSLTTDCFDNKAVYVRCPLLSCGRQQKHDEFYRIYRNANSKTIMDQASSTNSTKNRLIRGPQNRVVGGWKSEPGRWPWLVAIYKDGLFHCGGVIIGIKHILTAAHCFAMYQGHYFEVHAGMLRRLSFSPEKQILDVKEIFIYADYETKTMQNDLCVVELGRNLKLNRWVGIVCLPPAGVKFPAAGDICTAVGWGATFEHGPDPDQMHEVDVPIMSTCKHKADRDAEEICAGAIEGGKDTCQGDSGGPLMCRSQDMESVWFVSGIVSHGEGCARPGEPGAYTRVSLYFNWIFDILHGKLRGVQSMAQCPGKYCHDGRCIAAVSVCDGYVDCLNAEDEMDCPDKKPVGQDLVEVVQFFPLNRSKQINDTQEGRSSLENYVNNSNPKDVNNATSYDVYSENEETLPLNDEITNSTTPQYPYLDKPKSNNTKYQESSLHRNYTTSENSSKSENDNNASRPLTKYLSVQIHPGVKDSFSNKFSCKRFHQEIKQDHRCDGYIDCEDGSDEQDCRCRDFLRNFNPDLLCDSRVDCFDGTDEEDCISPCEEGQIFLPGKRICINEKSRCNFIEEFPDGEDEEGCYFLVANVSDVQFERNSIVPSLRGLVMRFTPGMLHPIPICTPHHHYKESTEKAIRALGFGGWKWTKAVRFSKAINCTGVYGVAHEYPKFGPRAPWLVSTSANGTIIGTGALIDDSWVIMASNSLFDNADKLNSTYLTVRAGFMSVNKGNSPRGLYEEIIAVDKAVVIPNNDLVLLRLQRPIKISPTVKPLILLENIRKGELDKCFVVGLRGNSKIEAREAVKETCPQPTCYTYTPADNSINNETSSLGVLTEEILDSETWSGAVWCEDGMKRPYLDCIFDLMPVCQGPCSFTCKPVSPFYSILANLTDTYAHHLNLSRSKRYELNLDDSVLDNNIYEDYGYAGVPEQLFKEYANNIDFDNFQESPSEYPELLDYETNRFEEEMNLDSLERDKRSAAGSEKNESRTNKRQYYDDYTDSYHNEYNEYNHFYDNPLNDYDYLRSSRQGLNLIDRIKQLYHNKTDVSSAKLTNYTRHLNQSGFIDRLKKFKFKNEQQPRDDNHNQLNLKYHHSHSDEIHHHEYHESHDSEVDDHDSSPIDYIHDHHSYNHGDDYYSDGHHYRNSDNTGQTGRNSKERNYDSIIITEGNKSTSLEGRYNTDNRSHISDRITDKPNLNISAKQQVANKNDIEVTNQDEKRMPHLLNHEINLNENTEKETVDLVKDSSVSSSFIKTNELVVQVLDVGINAQCQGVRCLNGLCITWNKVGDGFHDCLSSFDETVSTQKEKFCLEHPEKCKGCRSDEISCGDRKCIPVEKFCNGINDCESKIDEPVSCSNNCSSYLALKQPHRLCDWKPDCHDGSDESWQTCGHRFACNQPDSYICRGSNNECIHGYQVCDGIKDCVEGDDEETCVAVQSNPQTLWEGNFVSRRLGKWVASCLKSELSDDALSGICHSLRKSSVKSSEYKNITVRMPFLEPYSTFSLNSHVKFSVIGNRPSFLYRTIQHCLSLYITCN